MSVQLDIRTTGIAHVTLDDPERYNALTVALVQDLKDVLTALKRNRSVRAVVLHGAGRGFCAGANLAGDEDLAEVREGRGEVGFIHAMQEHLAEMVLAVRELPKPVIAAVHGAAVGGGLALALACDLRVASEDAVFAAQFIRVGLSSCDVGTSYMLPRICGPTIAAELMLTGRQFGAWEAHRIGVLNRVVPRDELLGTADELALAIAENSEYGVTMTKIGMWANLDAPSLRHAMELENRTQVLGTFTGNMTEAGQAFRERRDPRWKPM